MNDNANSLDGMRVAVLLTDGFEEVEMVKPREALQRAGARIELVSPAQGKVQGWNHDEKDHTFPVDVPLDRADPQEYDGLMLPGGVRNPDQMRLIPKAVQFVRHFFEDAKPVAAICHAPWMLVEAGVVRGRHLTSWPSLQTDLRNAGADWEDDVVVRDDGLVTSRKPDDIPAFNEAMIHLFAMKRSRVQAGAR